MWYNKQVGLFDLLGNLEEMEYGKYGNDYRRCNCGKGFEAAGCEAGVKYENRKDMALVYSQSPCTVAGVFTSNVAKAAPVRWDKNVVTNSPYAQAVIVNTGIANAGTGTAGYNCCRQTAQCLAETLDIPWTVCLWLPRA